MLKSIGTKVTFKYNDLPTTSFYAVDIGQVCNYTSLSTKTYICNVLCEKNWDFLILELAAQTILS